MVTEKLIQNRKKNGPGGYGHHWRDLFGSHLASGGKKEGGKQPSNQSVRYLTRPWAKGPANYYYSYTFYTIYQQEEQQVYLAKY